MANQAYVWSELRRRSGRTAVTAIGLAAGVGLVMGIVGVSDGLTSAQNKVLSPLGSVGTSIIVTRTVAPTTSTTSSSSSSSSNPGGSGFGKGGGGFFARGIGGFSGGSSQVATLLNNNASVITDLAKLGPAGTHFTHDFFVPGTLITFPSIAITDVSKIAGVTSAEGALYLQALHETGTVPKIVASVKTGGQTINTTVTPPALTAAQKASERSCILNLLQQSGVGAPSGGGGGLRKFANNPLLSQCLTPAQISYEQQVVVPERTITQVLNPPTTNISTSSFTVAGINPANQTSGLVTKSQVTSGNWFSSGSTNQILVNTAYASTNHLSAGGTLAINGTSYKIQGLVSPTLTGNVSDIYFPLATMQKLASASNYVNEVLVTVKSASDVKAVTAAIHRDLPGATVLNSKSLADQVTGSLANASKLATDLGGALAVVVIVAAFLIAGMLTLSNVSKRVREIGSLRAIGWSRSSVVGQIMAETVGIGVLGGVLGIGIGAAICAAIGAIGPALSVTETGLSVGASTLGSIVHQSTTGLITTQVHLTAPIHLSTIGLAFVAALVGGAIAGAAGGWRAAHLAPASALRDLN